MCGLNEMSLLSNHTTFKLVFMGEQTYVKPWSQLSKAASVVAPVGPFLRVGLPAELHLS